MKKLSTVVGTIALAASSASATFTGWSVVQSSAGGHDVYQVFANFSNSTDIPLNVFSVSSTVGTMNAVHTDAEGSWAASAVGNYASDSYVTMAGTGLAWGTVIGGWDPPVGSSIPSGAGWSASSPTAVGATQKRTVLQIARVAGDQSSFAASMTMSYKVAGTTIPLFGSGSFAIPAPGALAVIGLAGFGGRRRR